MLCVYLREKYGIGFPIVHTELLLLVHESAQTADLGEIQSPNHPLPYGLKEHINFSISLRRSGTLLLEFLAFQLAPRVGGYCDLDRIMVISIK